MSVSQAELVSRLYQAADPVSQIELIVSILTTLAGVYALSQTAAYSRAGVKWEPGLILARNHF